MKNQSHLLAAGILIIKNKAVLLVRDKHGWSLPKGSCESGETFEVTATREAKEETGLDILIIKFRPQVIPFEHWIINKSMKYHSFDLDVEGFKV
ncbi:NUDIX domain-containing protein [Paenibacillus sp. TAB 01]|uniref:NUDIX domain-containing protein n=1 Tax=Paenibacillus sp. TAB 01 TaxID=3368988 RepID=UPI00375071B6